MIAMRRSLNTGEGAEVDRWLAALHDGEARWPFNERVQADPRMDQLLRDGLQGPEGWEWQTLRPGHVWLVWPAALTAVNCEPGQAIADVASESFPLYAQSTPCERCGVERAPIAGAVVMNAGAVLVGVLVCDDCANHLEMHHGPVKWIRQKED